MPTSTNTLRSEEIHFNVSSCDWGGYAGKTFVSMLEWCWFLVPLIRRDGPGSGWAFNFFNWTSTRSRAQLERKLKISTYLVTYCDNVTREYICWPLATEGRASLFFHSHSGGWGSHDCTLPVVYVWLLFWFIPELCLFALHNHMHDWFVSLAMLLECCLTMSVVHATAILLGLNHIMLFLHN